MKKNKTAPALAPHAAAIQTAAATGNIHRETLQPAVDGAIATVLTSIQPTPENRVKLARAAIYCGFRLAIDAGVKPAEAMAIAVYTLKKIVKEAVAHAKGVASLASLGVATANSPE